MTPLVIAGAGGFARETAAAVTAIRTWDLRGFLDDDPMLAGTVRAGLPILGPLETVLPGGAHADAQVVVCVGNPRDYQARERIVQRLDLPVARYATIVHPSAALAPDTLIGPGSVLLAQVAATTAVTVGSHVAVMPQVVLTHDDVIGDFATIASGVRLGGGVHIGRGAYLGAGSLIREGLSIGDWSMVGLGSVVLHDVPPGEVWVGAPAHHLRASVHSALLENRS